MGHEGVQRRCGGEPRRCGTGVGSSRGLNRPSLVGNGTGFIVAFDDTWASAGDIYASRLNSNGVSLDPAGFLVSANPVSGLSDASIAFDGTNYLIAWQDTRFDAGDIYAARVAPSGRVVGRLIVVSSGVGAQRFPSVAFDGTNFLVVWSDTRSGAFDIYGARVSKAGAVLDTAGIPISVSAGAQDLPDVAWNGARYLVVWQDLRNGPDDAYGTRVTTAGIVQNPSGIRISSPTATAERFITVNSNGSAFLVAWGDERNATGPDLYAARVDDAGTVLDPTGRQIAMRRDPRPQPRSPTTAPTTCSPGPTAVPVATTSAPRASTTAGPCSTA